MSLEYRQSSEHNGSGPDPARVTVSANPQISDRTSLLTPGISHVVEVTRVLIPAVPEELGGMKDSAENASGMSSAIPMLSQAHDGGNDVFWGFIQPEKTGDPKQIAGGEDITGLPEDTPEGGKEFLMSYIPGAGGVEMPTETLKGAFAKLPFWQRIDVKFAPPKGSDMHRDVATVREQFGKGFTLEGLRRVHDKPFGMLVLAEPIDKDETVARRKKVGAAQRNSSIDAESGILEKVRDARHLTDAHEELDNSAELGQWKFTLLFGAANPDHLASSKRLAAIAKNGEPYKLKPGAIFTIGQDTPLDERTENYATMSDALAALSAEAAPQALPAEIDPEQPIPTNHISTQFLSSFFTPPAEPLSGQEQIRERRYATNEKIPAHIPEEGRMPTAQKLDARGNVIGELQEDISQAWHTLEVAGTNSGKTELQLHRSVELSVRGIANILFDNKAGGSLRRFGARLQERGEAVPEHLREVIVLRPGAKDMFDLGFSGLVIPEGVDRTEHLRKVSAITVNALEHHASGLGGAEVTKRFVDAALLGRPDANFPSVFDKYRGRQVTWVDVIQHVEDAVKALKYLGEAKNLEQYCRDRIASINRGKASSWLNGKEIIPKEFMGRNIVIELDETTDPVDQALVAGLALLTIDEQSAVMKQQSTDGSALKHMLHVHFDDALKLFGTNKPGEIDPTRAQIDTMVTEVRDRGVSISASVQSLTYVSPLFVQNVRNLYVGSLGGGDIEAAAIALGYPGSHTLMRDLRNLRQGEFFYNGPYSETMITRTFDPRGLSNDKTVIAENPKALISTQPGEVLYTNAEVDQALEQLTSKERGGEAAIGLAELYTIIRLVGLPYETLEISRTNPTPQFDALRAERQRMDVDESGEKSFDGKRIGDATLKAAVAHSVNGRAGTINGSQEEPRDLDAMIASLSAQVTAIVAGDPIPPDLVPTALHQYRYLRLRAEVQDHMERKVQAGEKEATVGRHPDSEKWEEALGHPVPGATAKEQFNYLRQAGGEQLGSLLSAPHPQGGFLLDRIAGSEASKDLDKVVDKLVKSHETTIKDIDYLRERFATYPVSSEQLKAFAAHQGLPENTPESQLERVLAQAILDHKWHSDKIVLIGEMTSAVTALPWYKNIESLLKNQLNLPPKTLNSLLFEFKDHFTRLIDAKLTERGVWSYTPPKPITRVETIAQMLIPPADPKNALPGSID